MTNVRPLYLPMTYQDGPDHGRLILRDGSTATIRLSRREDLDAVKEFYTRLSPQSRRMRFFSESKPGEDVMLSLCDSSDPRRGMTLLVFRFLDGGQRIIASGSYIAMDAHAAEFAVAVDDRLHGKGLGGLILERLSVLATSHGFLHFHAFTHSSNQPMLEVFRNSGFELSEQFQDGVVEVKFSLAPGQASVSHALQRDRLFTKASIRPFFSPQSIAVIGASRDPANPGHRLFITILRQQFRGVVYPVNPNASQVSGVKAYPTAEDLPEAVDLVVVAVPYDQVPGVVESCARRGARALIIISTGYAESGEVGKQRQQALLEQVRGYGMRMLGPNCLGIINTDPDVQLNASLSAGLTPRGKIAISSQSGALGMALLQLARQRNLGISMFASMGNKADVTGNDLLYFWEDDPATEVILLYLESFGNPRRFGRIAREVSRRKPILCVKAGRRVDATGEHAVEALFRQTGVLRMPSLEEMFDVAALLGSQPLPAGPQVSVISNSHGAAVLCEDACAAEGLIVSRHINTGADDSPERYQQAVREALVDNHTHALIVIYIPVDAADPARHLQAIGKVAALHGQDKPLLLVMTSGAGSSTLVRCEHHAIPSYLFPEMAAHALSAAWRYRSWRDAPPGLIPDFEDINITVLRDQLLLSNVTGLKELLGPAGFSFSRGPPEAGVPVEIEVQPDPVFGPVVSFSLAGYHRDVLRDISYRMIPLTDEDARSLVESIRGFPLLQSSSVHLENLRDLILRLSFIIEEIPEIEFVRLAPVYAGKQGCTIGGGAMKVAGRAI